MHCLETNTQHTEGCIALEKKDLFHVLKYVNKSTKLVIQDLFPNIADPTLACVDPCFIALS